MSNHARMLALGTGLLLSGCSDLTSQQRAWRDEGVLAYRVRVMRFSRSSVLTGRQW